MSVFVLTLVALTVASAKPDEPRFPRDVFETVTGAELVEVFIVSPNLIPRQGIYYRGTVAPVGGHAVVERGPELTSEQAEALKSLVMSESSYHDPIGPMGCLVSFNHAIRFVKGDAKVEALICFFCHRLVVWHQDSYVGGGGTFSPVAKKLGAAFVEFFGESPLLPN